MSGKILIILMIVTVVCMRGEIIHFSKLKKENVKFSLNRDIFSPLQPIASESQSGMGNREIQSGVIKEEAQKDLEKEIQSSVFFEGYIEKNQKALALVSVNGEFFVVAEGDVLMDKAKIIKIEKDKMILEVDSQHLEIQLKGESHD